MWALVLIVPAHEVATVFATCLFCHSSLGANQSIEHFPVGKRLAFDAERGRLWAVCLRCGRWNLSPLEERWEAIEECERAYRGTTQRVSTDNIALARLKDGTDLVRIGRPLLPEFAAWRYGDQLGVRRKRHNAIATIGGISSLGHFGLVGLMAADVVTGAGFSMLSIGINTVSIAAGKKQDRPVTHVAVPGVARLPMRAIESYDTTVSFDNDRQMRLHVTLRVPRARLRFFSAKQRFTLTGDAARKGLSSAIVGVNHRGAKNAEVKAAVAEAERSTTAQTLLDRFAENARNSSEFYPGVLAHKPPEQRFALEMLLHEEDERRAMAGELGDLYARWQDAERIANIADAELTPLPSNES